MYAVLYRFDVRPGREQDLVASWDTLTRAIHTHRHSLGSRLHRAEDGAYIAYAQWPSRDVLEDDSTKLPPSLDSVRKAMRDACSSITTLHRMEMVVDRLVPLVMSDESE